MMNSKMLFSKHRTQFGTENNENDNKKKSNMKKKRFNIVIFLCAVSTNNIVYRIKIDNIYQGSDSFLIDFCL